MLVGLIPMVMSHNHVQRYPSCTATPAMLYPIKVTMSVKAREFQQCSCQIYPQVFEQHDLNGKCWIENKSLKKRQSHGGICLVVSHILSEKH